MNETLFSQIQRLFERTYAQVGINLEDCLIDRTRCAQLSMLAGKSALELSELARTFLRRAGDQLYVGIYYSRWLIEQLEQHDPRAGVGDRKLCDYVASLLETFSHASRLRISDETHHLAEQYISDILIALNRATPEQAFLLRAHIGNYSLFISGIFYENTQRRSLRGGPDIEFYEQIGRTNYQLVSSHVVARRCELDDVFEGLADRFRDVRIALNQLSDQLLNLDEDARPSISL